MYLGEFAPGEVVHFKFTTVNSSGVPTALAGSPVISVYESNDPAQSTAGVTLTVDFDSVTGLNHVFIDLSASVFYFETGNYQVVITTGTVGGSSVVGYVLAHFGIFSRPMQGIGSGTVGASATTTSLPLALAWPPITVANQWKGRVIIFAFDTGTAALRGQATDITANTSGGILTVTALTTAPASGDKFYLV